MNGWIDKVVKATSRGWIDHAQKVCQDVISNEEINRSGRQDPGAEK